MKKILLLCQIGTLISWIIFLGALYLPLIILFKVDSKILGAFTFTLPLAILFFARALDRINGRGSILRWPCLSGRYHLGKGYGTATWRFHCHKPRVRSWPCICRDFKHNGLWSSSTSAGCNSYFAYWTGPSCFLYSRKQTVYHRFYRC